MLRSTDYSLQLDLLNKPLYSVFGGYMKSFIQALGFEGSSSTVLREISKKTEIPYSDIKYYENEHVLPSDSDFVKIEDALNIPRDQIKLSMGIIDNSLLERLSQVADGVGDLIPKEEVGNSGKPLQPVFQTDLGKLYQADCIELMKSLPEERVDLVFADPPFNLNKLYPSKINDGLKAEKYLSWTRNWLEECIRILKPGGSLFVWNLPKWNTHIAAYLNSRLTFRHWIAVDIKYSLPIQSRLYPSHYALLYYCKGPKPNTFHPDRLPMQTCPHCFRELKDYGGYKNKMNPSGINLSDVWYDIPPVRHKKYMGRSGSNELSIKLMDRIIEMSTNEGDVVFDPFGGSGTTYIAAEIKNRKWLGSEIGPVDDIEKRFSRIIEETKFLQNYRQAYNKLFPDNVKAKRKQQSLWTDESFK